MIENQQGMESFFEYHSHTHPFNGPFSRSAWVGRYQKGKTNLDCTEARDSEWQWHQLGICKSAPHCRQITMPAPHHSVFYRPDALPAAQPTASRQYHSFEYHSHKTEFVFFWLYTLYKSFACLLNFTTYIFTSLLICSFENGPIPFSGQT